MTTPSSGDKEPKDALYWAQLTSMLQISRVPTGALNLNVEGRQVVGPLQGFGCLWQKTYRVHLPGITLTPKDVMSIWKTEFPSFLPPGQRFYPVMNCIEPGQIILINASLSGMPVSTGVLVLYADDEAFTVMTPQGHPESGWNTFSVATGDDGGILCQIQSLARANDPIYELGFRLAGASVQEHMWVYVLQALAKHFKVNGQVESTKVCVDSRVQWSQAKNIWQNAAIRTVFYTISSPVRRLIHR